MPTTTRALDVHVISHTHWDREWYLTREQYRIRLVGLIDRVLDLMDAEPRFSCFHLDGQTIVLEDYLEVRPEQAARLRRRIGEGRLLVGPWYVMPDMLLVSGEALVRNLALGHRVAESFGGVMRAGYTPDPFGHVAQMPQILAGFGLDSAILWRGFGGERAEYWWEAPDGSRVLLLHLPREGYCNALRLPLLPAEEMGRAGAAVVEREAARSLSGALLLMAGVDHVEPHPGLLELPGRLAQRDAVRARLSTLPDYVAAVRAGLATSAALETVRGELRAGEDYANLLPGVTSSRVYLKQANARAQNLLERVAEPAALFAHLAGEAHQGGLLAYCWRTLLQNHPHDSICGCSVDAVHAENETRFARVLQAAESVAEEALQAVARRVPPPPAGALRCLAFNSDAAPFTGLVEGFVDVPVEVAEPERQFAAGLLEQPLRFLPRQAVVTAILDDAGHAVPFQLLSAEERVVQRMSRFEPPLAVRVRRLHLLFWAEQLPGCGYACFDLRFSQDETPTVGQSPRAAAGDDFLQNEHLRAEVKADGTLEVTDRASGRVYRRCLELLDEGDVGDEYNHAPPARDHAVTSAAAQEVGVRRVQRGPLRASLRVELSLPVPAHATENRGERGRDTTPLHVLLRVSLDAGSSRLDFGLTLDNGARDHRLRAVFPTAAARADTTRADSAFGVVRRAARRAAPAFVAQEAPVSAAPMQSVVDVGDVAAGVTLLSEGLMEYELLPGDEPRLALTLLRCVGDLSRDDLSTRRGHAGPGLETPGAQCLGRLEARFAMQPRATPPAAGALLAASRAFLAPPRLVSPAGPVDEGEAPSLPARGSFLRVEAERPGVVLSACKRADDRDAIVLRLFNPDDDPVALSLGARRPLAAAFALDLREQRQAELELEAGTARLTLPAQAIRTVELKEAP